MRVTIIVHEIQPSNRQTDSDALDPKKEGSFLIDENYVCPNIKYNKFLNLKTFVDYVFVVAEVIRATT